MPLYVFGGSGGGSTTKTILEKTANYSVLAADTSKTITNRGASGVVVLSLPAAPVSGTWFTFIRVAAFALRIDPDASDAILYSSGLMANGEYLELASVQAKITVVWDGTNWICEEEYGSLLEETP